MSEPHRAGRGNLSRRELLATSAMTGVALGLPRFSSGCGDDGS